MLDFSPCIEIVENKFGLTERVFVVDASGNRLRELPVTGVVSTNAPNTASTIDFTLLGTRVKRTTTEESSGG